MIKALSLTVTVMNSKTTQLRADHFSFHGQTYQEKSIGTELHFCENNELQSFCHNTLVSQCDNSQTLHCKHRIKRQQQQL